MSLSQTSFTLRLDILRHAKNLFEIARDTHPVNSDHHLLNSLKAMECEAMVSDLMLSQPLPHPQDT